MLSSVAINISASETTTINVYVYQDYTIIKPESLQIIIKDNVIDAEIQDDGKCILQLNNPNPGTTGTFSVVYQTKSYTPRGTLTIREDQYIYNIELYLENTDNYQEPVDDDQPDDNNDDTQNQINRPPVADAGGRYYQNVNTTVYFSGTKSYDPDGTITKYEWDFGDKTTVTGATATHTYEEAGRYTVTLTVWDNEGKRNTDTTYADIKTTTSSPPPTEQTSTGLTKPILTGPTTGHSNIYYKYTAFSTDPDNDSYQYIYSWSDTETDEETDFIYHGTYTLMHKWTEPGIYTVTVYARDKNNKTSEPSSLKIIIDLLFLENLGYMIDNNTDGIYDIFYSNTTHNHTNLGKYNDKYLIDTNSSGTWNYEYNTTSETLSTYIYEVEEKEEESKTIFVLNTENIFYILLIISTFLVILGEIYIYKRKMTPSYSFYFKENETDETRPKTIDEEIEEINKRIEEIKAEKEK